MFSPDIVESDAFLDMPASSQSLYFHLGMYADDDGFVGSPKKISKIIGSNDDDLKILISKRFILIFENGIIVIKHWLIHNLLRSDLYHETQYKKEKSLLGLNENGAYTELREGVAEIKKIEPPEWLKKRKGMVRTANVPQTALRLGKDRLGKDRLDLQASPAININPLIKEFEVINPTITYNNITQRKALEEMIKKFGYDELLNTIRLAVSIQGKPYSPVITTPCQLKDNMGKLLVYFEKEKNSKPKVINLDNI